LIDKVRKMKGKAIYLTAACAAFVIGVAVVSISFFQSRYKSVSADGGSGGFDFGGGTYWSQSWESPDGVMIYESSVNYPSTENAHKALEQSVNNLATVIERRKSPNDFPGVDERVVGVLAHPESKEKAIIVIRLQGKDVYHLFAPSQESALAFERSRLKGRW
jgi:hypothetical protein